MPVDTTILEKLLQAYAFVFSGGYAATMPGALFLLKTAITVEIAFFGLWMAIGEDHSAAVGMGKLFTFGVLVWLLTSWPEITAALQESFIKWGIVAGGSAVTVVDFRSPGNLFAYGAQVGVLLIKHLQSFKSWQVLFNLVEIACTGLMAVFVLAAFGVLTLQVAFAMLEFYLRATLAILLIPCAAFRPLAGLAEKAVSGVIANGFRLTVLALIVSAAQPAFTFLALPEHPSIEQVLSLALGVGFLLLLAWNGPGLAMSVMNGVTFFTAQQAIQTAITVGSVAGGMAQGAASVVQRVAQGASAAVGATQAAYRAGGLRGVGALATMAGQDLTQGTMDRYSNQAYARGLAYVQAPRRVW